MATSDFYKPIIPASIPVPKIRLLAPLNAGLPTASLQFVDGKTFGDTLISLTVSNVPQIIATDIPQELLDPRYGLQVELGRYSRRHGATGANKSWRDSGIVHPSNAISPSPGSFTRGGDHDGSAGSLVNISAIRQTEWPVTSNGQVINVGQGCATFMELSEVAYRSTPTAALLDKTTTAIIPGAQGKHYRFAGRRFAYDGRLFPGRFWFRYSIIDTHDNHTPQKRVSGGWSAPITLSSKIFPFTVTFDTGGWPIATINPLFNPTSPVAAFTNNERTP